MLHNCREAEKKFWKQHSRGKSGYAERKKWVCVIFTHISWWCSLFLYFWFFFVWV